MVIKGIHTLRDLKYGPETVEEQYVTTVLTNLSTLKGERQNPCLMTQVYIQGFACHQSHPWTSFSIQIISSNTRLK